MDPSKISNADFAKFQRKLVDAGYLKKGYVAEGAYWEFDFSGGREAILAGVERFLRDVGLLTKKEQLLLAWMLNRQMRVESAAATTRPNSALQRTAGERPLLGACLSSGRC